MQIGLIGALIFPSLVSIILYPPIDLISVFVIFCFGVTLFFSAIINGYSKDLFVKFLQGPFLILILLFTPLSWYRVDLFWGIVLGVILVIILVLLPLFTRRLALGKQALNIIFFEGVLVLGLSIYQVITNPLSYITVPAFLQFLALQGIVMIYFHRKDPRSDQIESPAILP